MKYNLFLLCGLLPLFQQAQLLPDEYQTGAKLMPDDTAGSAFFDDFTADLPEHWMGDIASFAIVDNRLCLAEAAAPPISVATPSARSLNTVWEAGIQVNDEVSASNYIRLYLACTSGSFRDAHLGYHLQLDGADGSHVYRLWRQDGHVRSIVFQSNPIPNQSGNFRVRIRVIRNGEGHWQLLADEYDNGTFITLTSTDGATVVADNTGAPGGYLGYFVNCSPARRSDFKLDYLLIKPLDAGADSIQLDAVQPNDIIINEILSNPKPDGVDFVEIYNNSDKTIDLQQIDIASVNSTGVAGSRRKVANDLLPIYPQTFAVLTTQPTVVKNHYPEGDVSTFIEVPTLPNFNNETGGVVLYSREAVIDSFFYTPAMQSPLITNHKGISLERQRVDVPSQAPGNFRSAAISVGGATPGYQNSQGAVDAMEAAFSLASKTFSPDNDGFEDQLEINYHFPESGFMANIDIYNDKGHLVRTLQRNQSMATRGTIVWDGLSDTNQRLPVGIYIALIETYHARGVRKIYRKSFALAAKL